MAEAGSGLAGHPSGRKSAARGPRGAYTEDAGAGGRETKPPRAEPILFGGFCLLILAFHIVLFRHAGAFWRDEASSLQIASSPTLGILWERLSKDSAPVLMYVILRGWTLTGAGATDAGLRLLGTIIALGIVASLFVSCRMLTGRAPLLATALVAFNPAVFYFGSSLRAYGLAMAAIMPCFALLFRVAQSPGRRSAAAALAAALLACHTSYQNSYLLFALGGAAAITCAVAGHWKRTILILGIWGAAAVSMLVYLPAIRGYREISETLDARIGPGRILSGLADVAANGRPVLLGAWALLIAAALAGAAARFARDRRAEPDAPSVGLYVLLAVLLAGGAALGFFWLHGITPFPWHYAPLLALGGMLVEVALRRRSETGRPRLALAAAACAVAVASLTPLWHRAHLRRTNLDRVARAVAAEARPEDLILLTPFWLAPGFGYHYRGAAAWNTVPLTGSNVETSLMPFLAVKQIMTLENAISPTLAGIGQTLAAGNRVWIVGQLPRVEPGSIPPRLPPAPASQFRWSAQAYNHVWSLQTAAYIQRRARAVERVRVDVPQPVDPLEMAELVRIEGWQPP